MRDGEDRIHRVRGTAGGSPPHAAGAPPPATSEDPNADLGFGRVVSEESRRRLLNRDGSFNVVRRGLGFRGVLSLYHRLLTMTWPGFLGLVTMAYLTVNTLFAVVYLAGGSSGLSGPPPASASLAFTKAFFFSVHTLLTIGYGNVVPTTLFTNLVVVGESLAGLFGFAVVTGLVFARFSRPTADIVFSKRALIAPYRGIRAFEFRVANRRLNQIVELQAQVLFSRMEQEGVRRVRRFYDLPLERPKVTFFPLSWTVVHPIDEGSPLADLGPADLRESDAEFLVLLTGIDESFSQTVHARTSYKAEELEWGARFADIFHHPRGDEPLAIDVSRIHELDRRA